MVAINFNLFCLQRPKSMLWIICYYVIIQVPRIFYVNIVYQRYFRIGIKKFRGKIYFWY